MSEPNPTATLFSTKFKRNKKLTLVLFKTIIMNIIFCAQKNVYAIVLITIYVLTLFHATFAINLNRSNQKIQKILKLHKNKLSIESRH